MNGRNRSWMHYISVLHCSCFFPVLLPLVDILLETIPIGHSGAPSEEGHYFTTLSPLAFDVLNLHPLPFLTFIPINYSVESCCGTFT